MGARIFLSCGEFQRSSLKFSSEIEKFKRDLFFAIFGPLGYPKDLAVLKIVRVVNLLRVVNLISHCNVLSRRNSCGHHFPRNYRHVSSRRRVRGVVNMGGGGSKKTTA